MKLSKSKFHQVSKYIQNNARSLDVALFNVIFDKGSVNQILLELNKYQNSDGGFGHGLEIDLWSPSSSPIATTIAIQYLEKIDDTATEDTLRKAFNYLSASFSTHNKKWSATPVDVNNFPHAPWWHRDEKDSKSIIDRSWANPTVEIIGYLSEYKNSFPILLLRELTDAVISRLLNYSNKMQSEHDLYCYIKLYFHLPDTHKAKIHDKLIELIMGTVNRNPKEWATKYVPKPLQFVDDPASPFYPSVVDLVEKHLDFLIHELESKEIWQPSWEWGQYESEWLQAKQAWIGKIAVDNLIILHRFSRIEM